MYLYFIKAYVEGHIVSYRGLVMKAPKLKTVEIPNYIPNVENIYFTTYNIKT